MPKRRGNGEGSIVRYKDGYRVIIVTGWKDKEHPIRHTKTGFRTVKEAREYISSFKSSPPSKKTLSDYWNIYEDNGLQSLSSSKQTHYRTVWRRMSSVAMEPMSLLTIARLQELVRGRTYYPARDVKNLLSHLYKLAIADGTVQTNLSSFIVLPELQEEETVPFTADEVERMWEDYAQHKETAYALLMTYTGMMPGELAKLAAEHIDFDLQTITGVGVKTNRRRSAALVFPDVLVPVLRELVDRSEGRKILPYKMDRYRQEFKQMVLRIGADARCTPYSCRHTFATMLAAKVPATILARLMRNDIDVTDKYYVHAANDTLLQEMNAGFARNAEK